MEHYENKQIFINDKYKGSGAQKDVPSAHTCLLRLCACVCVCGVFTEKFQFERRGRAIGRMKKPSERGRSSAKAERTAIGPCKLSQQPGLRGWGKGIRSRCRGMEILDSRYYFSFGAPFVPCPPFVNFGSNRFPFYCQIMFLP